VDELESSTLTIIHWCGWAWVKHANHYTLMWMSLSRAC